MYMNQLYTEAVYNVPAPNIIISIKVRNENHMVTSFSYAHHPAHTADSIRLLVTILCCYT